MLMAASSSGGFATPFLTFRIRRIHDDAPFLRLRRRNFAGAGRGEDKIRCCRSASSSENSAVHNKRSSDKSEEWRRFDTAKKSVRRVRSQALPSLPFASSLVRLPSKPYCTPRNTGPQSRDTPPKRDTGIASEKDWGINLLNENVNESGVNDDGSTWYRESGEELGENGYRCRWTMMGGQSQDGASEWKETWWEKSDWTGYKELGTPTTPLDNCV